MRRQNEPLGRADGKKETTPAAHDKTNEEMLEDLRDKGRRQQLLQLIRNFIKD